MRKAGYFKPLYALILVLLLVGLIGCSSSSNSESNGTTDSDSNNTNDSEEQASNTENLELDVWIFSGMFIEDQIEQYADENDININLTVLEQDDHQTNLTTALAAGSGLPDVTAIGGPYVEKYKQDQDSFVNLIDLGVEELEDDYLDFRWNMMRTPDGNFHMGLPTDVGPMVMVYREDIFEEAGLPTEPAEVEKLIQTWDDFIESGKQIKEHTGKGLISSSQTLFDVIIGQGDQLLFDTDNNLIVESNPQVERAWDYVAEISEAGLSANITRFSSEWGAAMNNGDYAVELAPSWMLGRIKENAPDTSGIWNIAQMPEGTGYWGGSMIAIPNGTEHEEEAFDLIKWLLSPEQQLETYKIGNIFPSTPSVYDSPEIQDYSDEFFSGAEIGESLTEAANNLKPVHYGPYHTDVLDILQQGVLRVESQSGTPEENWEQAMDEIERTLRRR